MAWRIALYTRQHGARIRSGIRTSLVRLKPHHWVFHAVLFSMQNYLQINIFTIRFSQAQALTQQFYSSVNHNVASDVLLTPSRFSH